MLAHNFHRLPIPKLTILGKLRDLSKKYRRMLLDQKLLSFYIHPSSITPIAVAVGAVLIV